MALSDLISNLTKHFGAPIIRPASEMDPVFRVRCPRIPVLDYLTGGGYPIGRVIEHVGAYSSLKSFTAYCMIAEFQHYDFGNHEQNAFRSFTMKVSKIRAVNKDAKKAAKERGEKVEAAISTVVYDIEKPILRRGYEPEKKPIAKRCALVDLEGTYTKEWGEHFGINNEALLLVQPQTLNQAVDIVIALLADPDISLVVFDSMGVTGPDAEADASMDKEQMGVGARFWNKAMRNIQAAINKNPAHTGTLILINSTYNKVGFVLGDPEEVKHGSQLKLTKTISLRFRALKEITVKTEEGEQTGGRNISVKCLKNKTGIPLRTTTFYYSYISDGLNESNEPDTISQLIDLGLQYGLVTRVAQTYKFRKLSVKGRDNFALQLSESGSVKRLREDVYESITADGERGENDDDDGEEES